jgi:protein-S-isoprenylcysteine O-methyltransferase Ste14
MTAAKFVVLLLELFTFGSFIWSLKGFFKTPAEGLPKQMARLRTLGGITIAAQLFTFLVLSTNIVLFQTIGGALLVASSSLFWWAIHTNLNQPLPIAYSDRSPTYVVKKGPYQFVRHPFYLSYSIAWLGGTIASGQPILILTCIVMGTFYFHAARFEEEQFRESQMAAEYENYRQRTGMFLPKFRSAA